jgi:hypothetical protein
MDSSTNTLNFSDQKQIVASKIRAVKTKLEQANATVFNEKKHDVILECEIEKDIVEIEKEIKTLDSIFTDWTNRFFNHGFTSDMKMEFEKGEEIIQLAWSHYEELLKCEGSIGQSRETETNFVFIGESIDFL